MGKGKGKKNKHGLPSNHRSVSSHGIEKRFRKESTQQASRIYLDPYSGTTVAPNHAFVPPAYPNVHAFPSGVALGTSSCWAAAHGEEMVSTDQLAGYIFMCNGKTKADCYRYRVFGLPPAKMDVLEKIKPPMKLFLFDFDLKLLHGIYIAASNGKLAIEPTAFGGRFSAQVRFEIFKDCLPLPESVFKHIVKDDSQGSHKFRQELSGKQVASLISLFRPIAMSLPVKDEHPGFEVPNVLAPKMHSMHLPPPPSGLFYPAEAHQSFRPKYPALPPQDPYSRYYAPPKDHEALSTTNVPVHPYVTGLSQVPTPLSRHPSLPPPKRTAAYWAAVASESLNQVYPNAFQSVPSVSSGLRLSATSAGAASVPPPVQENIDAELLEQLVSTANDNHQHNPAVASANPIVREPSANAIVREPSANPLVPERSANLVVREPSANHVVQEPSANPIVREPAQFQAPIHGTNVHLQPSAQVYPSTYQGIPSVSSGPRLSATSAGAVSTPPLAPESIDLELLQQLCSTANDNHCQNPAVASGNPIARVPSSNSLVREPSAHPLVLEPSANPFLQEPTQLEAPIYKTNVHLQSSSFSTSAPLYGTNVHQQPSYSSSSGYWTTPASVDPNLVCSVPYQWQWQQSANTGVGAENIAAGSALPYAVVQGSADKFVANVGTSNDYYAHNVHLATTNVPVQAHEQVTYSSSAPAYYVPVQAHEQVTYSSSAPAYWTGVPSQDPNQWYSGYYQVLPPSSAVSGGDPNQLYSGAYQVLPTGSSGLGGEHLVATSVAGAAATKD